MKWTFLSTEKGLYYDLHLFKSNTVRELRIAVTSFRLPSTSPHTPGIGLW